MNSLNLSLSIFKGNSNSKPHFSRVLSRIINKFKNLLLEAHCQTQCVLTPGIRKAPIPGADSVIKQHTDKALMLEVACSYVPACVAMRKEL